MNRYHASVVMARLRQRFERLYGGEAERCLERLAMMIGRYRVGVDPRPARPRWDARDAVLITYGDVVRRDGEKALATLKRFLDARLKGAFSAVHLLPFFPYSSDDGFSVVHFRQVNPPLGDWPEVTALGQHFGLAFDLVLNHVSKDSGWFNDYLTGVAPGRHYFIEADPGDDLSAVVRPRSTPLLTRFVGRGGPHHVWTTFSADQVDLNFAQPDVLFEVLDILLFYVSMGARVLRLDAIAYLWKKPGTPCIHLPETHEVVKLFRDFLELVAPDVLLLTETNVPQEENLSYFGRGDEAHMVYQFPLPPLVLHALHTGSAKPLAEWVARQPAPPAGCTVLNFTASHDGIGLRPLRGLVPDAEIDALVQHVRARGGDVSTMRNADGSDSPYELNITFFDALGRSAPDPLQVQRFLCSQMIPLALKGIPAVYFNSLVAAPNDAEGVQRTGRARAINRRKWTEGEVEGMLASAGSPAATVFAALAGALRVRAACPAFHPDGAQRVLDLGPAVFAVERTAPEGGAAVVAVSSVSSEPAEVVLPGAPAPRKDLLSGKAMDLAEGRLRLDPYQTVWLAAP